VRADAQILQQLIVTELPGIQLLDVHHIPMDGSRSRDEIENTPIMPRPMLCLHLCDLQDRSSMELQVQRFNWVAIRSESALATPVVVFCGHVDIRMLERRDSKLRAIIV
jgi:hypothetical protein